MTIMQPDPAAEFRKEKEFRAKVYRMLSLGLDTTEIENLLQCRIDWSLFSEETARAIAKNSNHISISIPPELINVLECLHSSVEQNKNAIQNYALKTSAELSDFKSEQNKKLESYFDNFSSLIAGSIIVVGSVITLIIILFAGIVIFK